MNADCAGLGANGARHTPDQSGIKGRGEAYALREHALLERAHAVEAFGVHHERDLETRLFGIEPLHAIVLRGVRRVPAGPA
jgi:hypothetical protein